MKFVLATLLTATLSFIAGLYLPWWSLAVVSFIVAFFIKQKLGFAFLSAFTGIYFLWGILALWIDLKDNHILSQKIAQLFPLGGSSVLLISVTALIGATVAGFAAMSGSSISMVKK